VTDIAEEVYYMVTGTPLQGQRTRLEPTPAEPGRST
jgi:hypothetical protein